MDNKRGRKGAFGGIVPLTRWNEGDYPSAPKDLPEPEAKTWKDTVRAMKPRWFHPACFPLLRSYCFTVQICERLAVELRTRTIEESTELLDQYDRMTRLMLSLATKLRITPKSNREGVYTGYSPATRLRRPWEDDDNEPPRKKLWERDDTLSGDPPKPDA